MLAVLVRCRARLDDMSQFPLRVRDNAASFRRDQPAGRKFDVSRAPDRPDEVLPCEGCTGPAAFDGDLASPRFIDFADATDAMALSGEIHREVTP